MENHSSGWQELIFGGRFFASFFSAPSSKQEKGRSGGETTSEEEEFSHSGGQIRLNAFRVEFV